MDQTVCSFITFLMYPSFRKTEKERERFKGRYGSRADNTVYNVQMDNLIHKDNMGCDSGVGKIAVSG